ncbi:protein kinase [Lutibacter sp.]|uniref:serine/threonine-protein kinase n=1 Tax=Lutibacter sp. TaxID=1925666 RepID=UPI003562F5B2
MQQAQIFAGRYRLENKIGSGGYSEVWLAKDEMAGDTEVAIKIFAPDKGLDQNGIKQFSKEYIITAKLQHTNLLIAKHYDIHEGSPYLVMPYCSKGSLQNELFEKGKLSEGAILQVLKDVVQGLHYLHNKGILHQDIKPDNILINDDDRYMLTDFGISTRMRSTLKKATSTNSAMTLAYAPPERYSANPENTKAGDVFSLGVMLYELATGDVPWGGDGGVMLIKGAEIPKIPNTYTKGFQDLVFACMSKDKEERPTTTNLLNFTKIKSDSKGTKESIKTPKYETKTTPLRKTAPYVPSKADLKPDVIISSNVPLIVFGILLVALFVAMGYSVEGNETYEKQTFEKQVIEEQVVQEQKVVEQDVSDQNLKNAAKHYENGKFYYEKELYATAISELNKAISLDSKYTRDKSYYDLRARTYYSLKEYQKAIEDYNKLITMTSGVEQAKYYNLRGVCYSYLNNFDAAKNDYKIALNLDSSNEQYKSNYEALNTTKNTSTFNDNSNKGQDENNKKATQYFNSGKSYYENKNYASAINSLNQAIKLNPTYYDNKEFYKIRAFCYYSIFQYSNAVPDYTKLINLSSGEEKSNYHLQRSICYAYMNKTDKSEEDLKAIGLLNNSDNISDNSTEQKTLKYPFKTRLKHDSDLQLNADLNSKIIKSLKKGTRVNVIDSFESFYKIEYNDKIGYIYKLSVDGLFNK